MGISCIIFSFITALTKRHFLLENNCQIMKLFYNFVIALFLIFLCTNSVFAIGSKEYYSELFKSWGFDSDICYSDEFNYTLPFSKNSVIVICSQKEINGCNYRKKDEADFLNGNIADAQFRDAILGVLKQPIEKNGKSFYFVPQILLTTPNYQEFLRYFFESEGRSRKSLESYNNKTPRLYEDFQLFLDSSPYRLFTYGVFVFALIFGLFSTRQVKKNPIVLNELMLNIKFIHEYLPALIALLFVIYIPVVVVVFVKWHNLGGVNYAFGLLLDTFNPYHIYKSVVQSNKINIGLFFLNYFLCAILLLWVVPKIIGILKASVKKSFDINFRVGFIKWTMVIIPISVSFTLLFDLIEYPIEIASFLIAWFIILAVYIRKNRISVMNMFSKPEVLLVRIVIIFLTIFSCVWFIKIKNTLTGKYIYKPLFSNSYKIMSTPYVKSRTINTLFSSEGYKGNALVFANDFLVYHPSYKNITIDTLANYKEEVGSFIVLANKQSDFIKEIVLFPELLNKINNKSYFSIFTTKNLKYMEDSTSKKISYSGTLVFNCLEDPNPALVELRVVYSGWDVNSTKLKRDSEDYSILDFPGCRDNIQDESFVFPLPLDFALKQPVQHVVFRILNLDDYDVKDLKIANNETGIDIPISFFPEWRYKDGNYNIAYSYYISGDSITAYVLDPMEKIVFSRTTDYKEMENLSYPINSLIKLGVLGEKFIIWANENAVLKINF
jgi:hypothetical protein